MSAIDFTGAINGIPLFWLVMAIVTVAGRFGVTGKWQLLTSLITGVVLGILYQASLTSLAAWGDWFGAIVYGLALGITASGIYETGKELLSK